MTKQLKNGTLSATYMLPGRIVKSYKISNVAPLTVLPSLCPSCCYHPCATVFSAAEWVPLSDLHFWQTVHEMPAWTDSPSHQKQLLLARDCENDLHVRGDFCHTCGCDPAIQIEIKKTRTTQIWFNVTPIVTSNWQRTVALLSNTAYMLSPARFKGLSMVNLFEKEEVNLQTSW